MTRTHQRATLAGIAAVAAVAALFALILGAVHPFGPGGAPTATATAARLTATASVAAPVGWTAAGPAYGETVAVAPSAPTTLYACGLDPQGARDGSQPITVGVSRDGGDTWQALPASPGPGLYCFNVRVSPVDPRYVALTVDACAASGCGSGAPSDLRRYVNVSADGGAHWTRLALPAGASAHQGIDQYAWAGTTLFVTSVWDVPRPAAGHVLAAGADGGPLAWADQNGLLAGVPSNVGLGGLYMDIAARDATLYFTCGGLAQCRELWQTPDGGRTWAHAASTFGGVGITIVATAPHGAPLLAFKSVLSGAPVGPPGPLLRSTDGGATWAALPALPPGDLVHGLPTFEAPDGSIFLQVPTDASLTAYSVYALRPGAAAWTPVVTMDEANQLFALAAIAWDAAGHPTTLWAVDRGRGIWRHAL